MDIIDQNRFEWPESTPSLPPLKAARTGAFTDNMKLPVHRWFRYSAGFSAEWVQSIIAERGSRSDELLFDPFVGSGTSLLAAQQLGVPSAGAEPHQFVCRVAAAKLLWNIEPNLLRLRGDALVQRAQSLAPAKVHSVLLEKCYSQEALERLESLRLSYLAEPNDDVTELLWLAITAILRECSGVGTAQWQYVLPNKTKAKIVDPYIALASRIAMFCSDIERRRSGPTARAILKPDDARSLNEFSDLRGKVSLVVTSPPYPNNYDYADATRLEMTFWRDIGSWGDLQGTVRNKLVRSCSQHSAAERLSLEGLLADPAVSPIESELRAVCEELATVREQRGGRKTYHTMVAAYFADLAKVWSALRPLCRDGADICFVIGDSAPYGVYVPVDEWFAKLATASGFHSPRFEKIRDRNLKWKNRKHRVPLKEGNFWVRG